MEGYLDDIIWYTLIKRYLYINTFHIRLNNGITKKNNIMLMMILSTYYSQKTGLKIFSMHLTIHQNPLHIWGTISSEGWMCYGVYILRKWKGHN